MSQQKKRSLIKFKNEDPNSKGIFFGSFTLNSREEKELWLYVKNHIKKDKDLLKLYGYDDIKYLSNSKIVKVMILYMFDRYHDKKRLLKEQLKNLRQSLIIDKINLIDKGNENDT